MSYNDTYFNPKLLDGDYDDQNQKRRHKDKHKHRHHRKTEEPILDVWTAIPLFLSFCLIILSSILIYKKSHSLPFCSRDEDFNECTPCPSDAICSKGKAKCKKGSLLSGKVCVTDTQADLKIVQLAFKIRNFIAAKPNKYCNESVGVKYEEILSNFRNEKYFSEALEKLDDPIYEIHIINNLYVSYNPTLDPKCRAYKFVMKNKQSLILMACALVLILVLFVMIKSKLNSRRIIKESALDVIGKLKDRKGKKIFIEELEPLKNEEAYKYWEQIIDEVESYEEVEVYNTEKGIAWKYSP